jgi:hypothetical protein
MDAFHSFLTVSCDDCKESLIRIAQTQFHDLAVCPLCFAAGPYEDVVEDGARLHAGYDLTEAVKDQLRRLRDMRGH